VFSSSESQAIFEPSGDWRECEGVEPSAHVEGRTPAELKSVRPTGTHPLPCHFLNPTRISRVSEFGTNIWAEMTGITDL